MPMIRPVSDLRNDLIEITKILHETGEPMYLTRNGYGSLVVMSMEAYEKLCRQIAENEPLQK